ncbi:MAG: hypothetical protein QOH27_2143 [Mycobacterium sp.]|nr:hypothetical protein [Mycobacterium sp.]
MRTPSALGSRGNQHASNVEESAPLRGGPGAAEDEFDRHFRCQRWADRWMNALDGVRLLLSWAEIEVAADEPVRCEKSMATFFPAWLRIV